MRAIITICSKNKDNAIGDIPAYLRYKSARIKRVTEIAKTANLPFFILSGKYGLIEYDKLIPFYDHLLQNKEINKIAKIVSTQIINNNISFIDFYAKPKLNDWVVYYEVLEIAAKLANIKLNIFYLNRLNIGD